MNNSTSHPNKDTGHKETREYKICPNCGQTIKSANLQRHLAKVHSQRTSGFPDKRTPQKRCPVCKTLIDVNKLEAHLKRGHTPHRPKRMVLTIDEYGVLKRMRVSDQNKTYRNLALYQKPQGHHYEICSICQALIESSEMDFHKRAAHQVSKPQKMEEAFTKNELLHKSAKLSSAVLCPVCKCGLKSAERLRNHLAKVHSDTTVSAKCKKNATDSRQMKRNISTLESLHQSFDEPRDGSKGLGHMRRENGRFGSYPLHDDYSDESDA